MISIAKPGLFRKYVHLSCGGGHATPHDRQIPRVYTLENTHTHTHRCAVCMPDVITALNIHFVSTRRELASFSCSRRPLGSMVASRCCFCRCCVPKGGVGVGTGRGRSLGLHIFGSVALPSLHHLFGARFRVAHRNPVACVPVNSVKIITRRVNWFTLKSYYSRHLGPPLSVSRFACALAFRIHYSHTH